VSLFVPTWAFALADQQMIIVGKKLAKHILQLHMEERNKSVQQKKSFASIVRRVYTLGSMQVVTFDDSSMIHTKPGICDMSFEECSLKFQTGIHFCRDHISFHRFRDSSRDKTPGKAYKKYFAGVCSAG
jgi:hypothetical protein